MDTYQRTGYIKPLSCATARNRLTRITTNRKGYYPVACETAAMRFNTKNSDMFKLLAIGVCLVGTVVGRAGGGQGKTSVQSDKTPATEQITSENKAVTQTVQVPVVAEARLKKVDVPLSASASAGTPTPPVPPVTLNEIVVSRSAPQLVPISYEFSYGTPSHSHVQNKHPDGMIKGRYVIHAPDGQHRTVDYVADKGGFRAGIATNEPGTETVLKGASKIVSSAMSGVDAALKFGSRHHVKSLEKVKQVQLPAEVVPSPQSTSASQTIHHVQVEDHAQLQQPVTQVQMSTVGFSPQFSPLRIVDIQPLPASFGRFERFEHSPPPPNVEVIPAQSQAPSHLHPAPTMSTSHSARQPLEPLPPSVGDNTVASVLKTVTLNPPVPAANLLNPPLQYASSAQIVPHSVSRFEAIPAQVGLLHRPLVHTVSEVSQAVPPQLLSPGSPHFLPQINVQFSHVGAQRLNRITQPSSPALQHPSRVDIIRPTVVHANTMPLQPVQQFLPPIPVQTQQIGPVQTLSKNIVRFQPIQPTKDAQIFEIKTRVVPEGGSPPPMALPPSSTENFVILPQHNSRHFLSQPKPPPGSSTVKIDEFASSHQRLRHSEHILKNLPPPVNRPQPPPGPRRFPEPIIFLAIPPSTSSSAYAQRLTRLRRGFSENENTHKLFRSTPAESEHEIAVDRFFSNIKQHHLDEVKMVKKHEDQLQMLASRVKPFFRVRQVSSALQPRMSTPTSDILGLLR
ncbi:hypothetical protein BIW11_08814 [Tropilaelaps mercedesae]|uniref:Cuticle protein 10.9-like n=1 Tax=Tropilaelaps mercedesae TaxID=418985 RepID=A0A1V9XNA8_9ACAR|nr:hypothetical protein BIW11_08814 [Tropilaelaps mercedesae]